VPKNQSRKICTSTLIPPGEIFFTYFKCVSYNMKWQVGNRVYSWFSTRDIPTKWGHLSKAGVGLYFWYHFYHGLLMFHLDKKARMIRKFENPYLVSRLIYHPKNTPRMFQKRRFAQRQVVHPPICLAFSRFNSMGSLIPRAFGIWPTSQSIKPGVQR